MEEMESTRVEKEGLAQKCHELEMQLNLMKEEKLEFPPRPRGAWRRQLRSRPAQ